MGLEVRVAGVCAVDFVDNVFVLVGRVVDIGVVVDFVNTVVILEVFGDDFVGKVLVAGRAVDVGLDVDFVDDVVVLGICVFDLDVGVLDLEVRLVNVGVDAEVVVDLVDDFVVVEVVFVVFGVVVVDADVGGLDLEVLVVDMEAGVVACEVEVAESDIDVVCF